MERAVDVDGAKRGTQAGLVSAGVRLYAPGASPEAGPEAGKKSPRARRLSLADQQDWNSRARFLREQLEHLFVDLSRQRKGFMGFPG